MCPLFTTQKELLKIEKFDSPVSCETHHRAHGTMVGEIGELHKPLLCSSISRKTKSSKTNSIYFSRHACRGFFLSHTHSTLKF